MSCFPICVDLTGKPVLLIGRGEQIWQKAEKLRPFGAELIYKDALPEDWEPALVIVGDTPLDRAEAICEVCCRRRIPVNVVDVPRLCSFYFPALIQRGSLTVSLSTGGESPAAAGVLRRRLEEALPDNTEDILSWLGENREVLRNRGILKAAAEEALGKNRPLTEEELLGLKKT